MAMLASLVVAGADVSYVNLIEPLVDRVIAARSYQLLALVPAIIVGLALVKGVGRFLQEYLIKTAGQLVVQDIRNRLFEHSMGLSMAYYARHSSGKMTSTVLNDVGLLQRSAADVLVDGLRESFALVGLVTLAFYKDWQLACVAFVVLPVSVVPVTRLGVKIKASTRKGLSSVGYLTGTLQQSFAGIKVIKAFGREDHHVGTFQDENRQYYRFLRRTIKYNSLATPMVELLGAAGGAGVVWYGVHRVLNGAMTQGELFSIVAAILMMYGPVKRLTKVSNTVQQSLGAAEGVFRLFDELQEIKDAPGAITLPRVRGEVRFNQVTFAYDEQPVLSGFDLHVRPGEVIALVGASGAGKSTVVGLLARFYDPTAGSVTLDDHDLRQVTLQSLKSNLAFVDQETFLFNTSIRENIRYGRLAADDAAVEAAAGEAYADEFIRILPQGYDTEIGDRGVRLSGGQRQRLCIARALLRDAPILILDEATSALDSESEIMVQKALANLMKNRTTFVVAHRLSTIMNADRILVLDQGRIVESGRHQELIAGNGLYRKFYDMQFREA
ncbi:MAG: ABC transporter permease [Desulfuromonas sp.]|nr:MAG: ABC transporter permease [Desulfuromonas sp.]